MSALLHQLFTTTIAMSAEHDTMIKILALMVEFLAIGLQHTQCQFAILCTLNKVSRRLVVSLNVV